MRKNLGPHPSNKNNFVLPMPIKIAKNCAAAFGRGTKARCAGEGRP